MSLSEGKFLGFNWTEFGQSNKEQIPADLYEFQFALQLNAIEDLRVISLSLITKLFDKRDNNDKKEICQLSSSVTFNINNFDEVLKKNGAGQILIPDQIIQICGGIAVSNIRGMFIIKLQDSIYSNALLPLIDPKILVPQKPTPIA